MLYKSISFFIVFIMKIHTGDTVIVMAGKNKGIQGKVMKVDTDKKRVIVEGANIVTKHMKPQ